MARNFITNEVITFPVPAALIGVDGGPLTIVAVCKLNTSSYNAPFYTRTSTPAHAWSVEFDTGGGLHGTYVTGTTARPVGSVSTGAYMVAIFRKDAGGTFQPVGRYLTGAGFTTDSGNTTAASTLIDGPALDSGGLLQIGRWGTTDYSNNIDIAAVAVWSSYLSDGTVVGLTSWSAITTASPTYWVKLDSSNVTDSAGQSPTITGTSVVADPSGFFGAADQNVAGNGITSAEFVGNATVSATYTINANGISSSERLGSTALSLRVTPSGIASSERLGSPSIHQTVSASGIRSCERLGAATVQAGSVTINAAGITSSEASGSSVVILAQSIAAAGITTAEAVGSATITVGPATINASGITSSEGLGSAQLGVSVTLAGIPSNESVGSPTITVTAAGISGGNIASGERLGSATVTSTFTIAAHGIRSDAQLGSGTLSRQIQASGIGSAEKLGSPTITVGPTTINALGILSATALGTPIITALPLIPPTPQTLIKLRIGQTVLLKETGQTILRLDNSETLTSL